MSKTACAVPFTTLDISADGTPLICCYAPVTLTVDGRPAVAARDPLEAIWNAPEIVSMRAAMARGEKPGACRVCWDHEAAGSMSLRRVMNEAVQSAAGAEWSLSKFVREAANTGFHLTKRPRWYQLQLGNTCNLKCRSCTPDSSSRIAADSVQSAWNGPASGQLPAMVPRSATWFRDPDKLAELVGNGDDEIFLSLLGGEPFVIEEVWGLLQLFVERGWSNRITLGLVTNGTRRRVELERLAPAFQRVHVAVSVDGYGPMFEYLRHGASWRELQRNLEWLQSIPGVAVGVTPTMQNANVLGAVKLFRFFDERNLRFHFNVLTSPARLSATNLPPRVRRVAAQRLRAYLDDECRPVNRAAVQGWVALLEKEHEFDPELFREFMEFTNDLDASRGQSFADADPELFALLRASGVEWIEDRRHVSASVAKPPLDTAWAGRINRTLSPNDAIYAVIADYGPQHYFDSGMLIVNAIDGFLRSHGHKGLDSCRAVADYASHYGRVTRVLQARMPRAVVYACDIDRGALDFCERELGAIPVATGWNPDEDDLPRDLDLVVCISLLTHTPRDHWRRTLRAWSSMLRPGGFVVFTFLSADFVERWKGGAYGEYGEYSADQRAVAADEFAEDGFAFVPISGRTYGGESNYGIAFARPEVVREEVAAAGLEVLDIEEESATFNQSVVIARKPGERDETVVRGANRDVKLIAFYDTRSYDHEAGESMWSRLVAAQPARPLPTELGFGDARVAEVREAQAALAREHGIDAFCFIHRSQWDAPLRELLYSGRPDFPFCLMWAADAGARLTVPRAEAVLIGLVPFLRDPRYLRYEDRPLLIVEDASALISPRATTARWREIAAAHELGDLHLCAAEPLSVDSIVDLGFDSALEVSAADGAYSKIAASALGRDLPPYPLFRTVLSQREPFDMHNVEHYELWLRSALETSRGLAFVRAWNDWAGGAYLEPDDRTGRDFLAATRRAVRGPSSGLVLLRRLRESLGSLDGSTADVLGELEQVVSMHERSREELTALVESSLARLSNASGSSGQRWVSVSASHLPPSSGRVSIDQLGPKGSAELRAAKEPIELAGEDLHVYGWAHSGDCDPGSVDIFAVLTSIHTAEERVYRLHERNVRADVAAAIANYPERCGFAGMIPFGEMPAGTYRIGIVQRTPDATYFDATPILVRRG